MSVIRPLPGIRFEAVAQPLRDVLPRMDIPVYAGFAASGPLHTPVAVEDIAQFANVFGGDVELPRPRASRESRFAYLAATVRAFFRNGGRRCWVIRVAGNAVENTFVIPGLRRVESDGTITPAIARARSEGSWSDAVRVQTNIVSTPLKPKAVDVAGPSIDVEIRSARDVERFDLVRVSWPDAGASLNLFVTNIAEVSTAPRVVRLTGRAIWLSGTQLASPFAPAGRYGIERLTFDLTIRRETEPPLRLSRLGFTPEHPRYFGALPTDHALFEDHEQYVDGATPRYMPRAAIEFAPNFLGTTRAGDAWPDLWRESATPRFPLAMTIDGALYVPAEMSAFLSEESEAVELSAPSLQRDGLDQFSADLFVDSRFLDTGVRDVLDRADALRYQAGETLDGIHAALGIEEATMLAAPDALHPGWLPDSIVPPASPPASSPLAHPEWWRWMDCREPRPEIVNPNHGGFVDCSVLDPIAAPLLTATEPNGGTFDLNWDHSFDASEEVQEATRPDFSDATTIAVSTAGTLRIYGHAAGDYFYRARRLVGARTSDWSFGIAVRIGSASGFVANDDAGTLSHVVTIHEAMINLCAARADMVAVLSLPRHYDHRDAIEHVAALDTLDAQTLSYGALWHPWLISRDDDAGPLRTVPPDGATTGVMAARAIARGAWVAPANEALRGVVALTPSLPAGARQELQDSAVNVIRHEPAGFVCLDSDTLTRDADLRALNVRRLLILLRRAAIRTGNDYAFEPNSTSLRNTIKRGFEAMLSILFARGAFAGRTAKTAFQVVTDATVNTPNSVDNGRLIAEIKVAPSRPLSFLTVRLIQRGEATLATEVRS